MEHKWESNKINMNTNPYKYTASERTTNKMSTCHSKERKGYWQTAEKGPKDLIIFSTNCHQNSNLPANGQPGFYQRELNS